VTTRTALRLRGEQRLPVGPLATPLADEHPPLAHVAAYPAVRLFVDRVREVLSEFSLDNSNVAAVAEICRRLDGLPLALELAAARMQLLSPAALLSRLDRRLHLLSDGPVDLPERQRTLRNTLAWSYDLLDATDAALFRRLAVFAGGWTLEAAEAVSADTDLPAADVVQRLGTLIDSSLIRAQIRPMDEGGTNEPRFGMHEIVREYALERLLKAVEDAQVRDRHLAFYLGLAETAEPHLDGADQRLWLDRLEREHDNLRAALSWSLHGAGAAQGLRLATVLLFFWFMHGHLREGRDALQTALAAADAVADPPTRGRALAALGYLSAVQGQSAEARLRLEAALKISRELNDAAGAAFALRYLGFLASADADYDTAGAFLEESLAVARRIGSTIDIAMALMYLGDVTLRHDAERARELFEESSGLCRQLGNNMVLAYPLRRLGLLAGLRGDIPQAVRLCVESLGHNRAGGERLGVAAALVALAPIADSLGEPEYAVQLLSKAEALASSIGGQLLPFEAEQYETTLSRMRAQLDPAAWARAWEDGKRLSLDEAVLTVENLARRSA
jgi:predicted ATPase